MKNFALAFRAFFRIFSDQVFARRVEALEGAADDDAAAAVPGVAPAPAAPAPAAPAPKPEDKRNAALTLLATLQREARLVDFAMEALDGYPDDQVGAAARNVHRDLGVVLRRLFAPEPLLDAEEGSRVEVPAAFDPERYRLVGSVGEPPVAGTLRHRGWRATRCEVPTWTGAPESTRVVAPAEVEV